MKEKLFSKKSRYLLGLSGQNILYALISSGFAYFIQFTVLIPALWVGIILSTGRIFDAVKDPFIGFYISKSKRSTTDFLRILPLPTAVLTVLCFAQKVYSPENSVFLNSFIIIYCFAVFLLWETAFSFGDIPMVSYPNTLSQNDEERKRLFSLRSIGATVCSIACLIIQPFAFMISAKNGGTAADERNAFLITAVIFSVIGYCLFRTTVSENQPKPAEAEKENSRLYKYIFTNPLLKKTIISGVLFSLNSLQGVVLPALITYYLSDKSASLTFIYTLLLGSGSFIGQLLSAVFVPKLSTKFGNIKSYVFCNIAVILPDILIFVLYLRNKVSMNSLPIFIPMLILLLVSGCFLGFASNIRTLMIDDAVELEYRKSGVKPTALFFSFVTALIKINSGISSLVSGIGYTLIGFSSEKTAALNEYISNGFIARENSHFTPLFTMLFFMFTVLPALSSFLAILPFIKKNKNCCVLDKTMS